MVLAYTVYFFLPWLPWTRQDAPAQAVLFDMVGPLFHLRPGVLSAGPDLSRTAAVIAAATLFFATGW